MNHAKKFVGIQNKYTKDKWEDYENDTKRKSKERSKTKKSFLKLSKEKKFYKNSITLQKVSSTGLWF